MAYAAPGLKLHRPITFDTSGPREGSTSPGFQKKSRSRLRRERFTNPIASHRVFLACALELPQFQGILQAVSHVPLFHNR
jgi:hypothetical protein